MSGRTWSALISLLLSIIALVCAIISYRMAVETEAQRLESVAIADRLAAQTALMRTWNMADSESVSVIPRGKR